MYLDQKISAEEMQTYIIIIITPSSVLSHIFNSGFVLTQSLIYLRLVSKV